MLNALFGLLMVIVVLAPLPFGSNRAWSWSLLAGLIALTVVLWSGYMLKTKRPLRPLPTPLISIGFLLALGWAGLQTVAGLPDSWMHPLWQMSEVVLQRPVVQTVSLSPDNTLTFLMRLLAYGLVFFLAFQLCVERLRAKYLLQCLSIAGLLYSLYGIVAHWGDFHTILWFPKWNSSPENLNSTFVNKNHFATYAGLTLLCAVAVLLQHILPKQSYAKPHQGRWRELELMLSRGWFPLLAVIIIFVALLLSHSRGGIVSTSVALCSLLLILLYKSDSMTRYFFTVLGGMGLVVLVVYSFSSPMVSQQLGQLSADVQSREEVQELVGQAIGDNPWTGFGLGAFEDSFRLYRNEMIPVNFSEAHNVYLESLFELGIPVALLLFVAVVAAAAVCVRGVFIRHRDWVYPAVGVAATVLAGLHSWVDFSLQIPAVAVTYACIMGAACAQSYSSR